MTYFLDLFAGIGGFALGAEWAELHFDKHYFSEVDDYAIKVYRARFPNAIPLGDIRAITGADLPSGDWIISGGFPCQDISVAGKGAGLAGARSGLWYEYARIIGELRPSYAIMENVGALTHRGLDRVLGSLAEIGYDAEWQDIRASDVGAPHRRERIWIVAYPNGERREHDKQSKDRRQTKPVTECSKALADSDSEHGLRRPEPQLAASAGGQSRDQSARCSDAGTGIMEDAIGAGAGSESGEACTDRRRGTGRDESTLRQAHGTNGADRIEPASQAAENVAYADEARPQGQRESGGIGEAQPRTWSGVSDVANS